MATLVFLLSLFLHVGLQVIMILRVLLRRHRDPASRIAWIVVILSLPVVGILAYALLGETNIGRRNIRRIMDVRSKLPELTPSEGRFARPDLPDRWQSLFQAGKSINGFEAVGGNRAELMADSADTIDRMVADIDAASEHVHILFYIWLPDESGRKVAEAVIRAAGRGVTCRVMVDDLGSRSLTRSPHWKAMSDAGVRLARALPIGNPLLRVLFGRIDLRNHRKIVVIDNRVTYCGSQNCADSAFLPKARYAPWVDIVFRVEGPVVWQSQNVFATDWMTFVDEDIHNILEEPVESDGPGFPAQVIASGPTNRHSAMPQMFQTLIYGARNELIITTPYYAPNGGLQEALCAAGNRGVDTTIVFPARNDDFAVGATSRSYYRDLLSAGVKILEFQPGLLHAKSITIDGQVAFIGSANMDRRSFDLNYENNMLIWDEAVTAALRARQQAFMRQARRVTLEEVEAWPWYRQLVNNGLAVVSPLL